MARSDRAAYYRKHSKTQNVLIVYKGKQYYGTLMAKRNFRLTIQEAAARRSMIAMLYTKLTTGETLEYLLEPYSYRYRKLRMGVRKVFFGFKVGDRRNRTLPPKQQGIRMFYLRNIQAVKILHRKYKARWRVEI